MMVPASSLPLTLRSQGRIAMASLLAGRRTCRAFLLPARQEPRDLRKPARVAGIHTWAPNSAIGTVPSGLNEKGKRTNYQSNRFRVAVDLIVTCGSVKEAIDRTRDRLAQTRQISQ